MGKQGELMEQMAKAQRDRKKKELEDKLRESGDLPPAGDAAPTTVSQKKMEEKKPERTKKARPQYYCRTRIRGCNLSVVHDQCLSAPAIQ